MRVRWENVAGAVALTLALFTGWSVRGTFCDLQHLGEAKEAPLEKGELVQHKVHDWHGVVLWNAEGPTICVRYYDADSNFPEKSLWGQDFQDVEWEKEGW